MVASAFAAHMTSAIQWPDRTFSPISDLIYPHTLTMSQLIGNFCNENNVTAEELSNYTGICLPHRPVIPTLALPRHDW